MLDAKETKGRSCTEVELCNSAKVPTSQATHSHQLPHCCPSIQSLLSLTTCRPAPLPLARRQTLLVERLCTAPRTRMSSHLLPGTCLAPVPAYGNTLNVFEGGDMNRKGSRMWQDALIT